MSPSLARPGNLPRALTADVPAFIIFAMAEEKLTQVSSAAFAKDPQRYLAEAQAGHVVEISSPEKEALVLISKEELKPTRPPLNCWPTQKTGPRC